MGLFSNSKKSSKRVKVIRQLLETMKSDDDIYSVIDYQRASEAKIKQFMYHPLLRTLAKCIEDLGYRKDCIQKAKNILLWESNKKTTVNNFQLFGVQHRPDFVIKMDDYSIAVEVKRGANGSSIRDGIGQAVCYGKCYDYVVYLFIDTSSDKRIRNSIKQEVEASIIEELWHNHNVLFDVV